jgi:hypothetical protein
MLKALSILFVAFLFFQFIKIEHLSQLPTKNEKDRSQDTLHYAFFAHVSQWYTAVPTVDIRVSLLDKSGYDRIWLGGDITSESSLNKETFLYIDSIFSISSPTTQYALGNHDIRNGNKQWYEKVCRRKSYNYLEANGAISVCLDMTLNSSDCENLNKQFKLIKDICDTIQVNKHLFIFGHQNPWKNVPDLPNPYNYAHTNFEYWLCHCDDSTAYFQNAIYPLLKQVRNRGIKVYNIVGDTGGYVREFHQENSDSIHFFSCGINNSKYFGDTAMYNQQPKDKILVFDHIVSTNEIKWSFQDLDSLLNVQ